MNELHFAVLNNNLDEVRRVLAENPALINSTDRSGNTALHWAARSGNREIITELLGHREIDPSIRNIDYTSKKSGDIAAIVAAKYGHAELAKFLLQISRNKSTTSNFLIVDDSQDWDIILPETEAQLHTHQFEDLCFSIILEDLKGEGKIRENWEEVSLLEAGIIRGSYRTNTTVSQQSGTAFITPQKSIEKK